MKLFKNCEGNIIEIRTEEHEVCKECGAWIGKINPVKIVAFEERTYYYCGKCKKPYQEVIYTGFSDKETQYRAVFDVKEDGTPVGYVKAKK